MIPTERRNQIMSILEIRGYVSINELAKRLYVSIPTIRRDLTSMEKDGQVRRTHGGVIYIQPQNDISPIELRNRENIKEKDHIGQIAASLLSDGQSLFIDPSSTSYSFVKHIPKEMHLNIVTNGTYIVQAFKEYPNVRLEVTGGTYDFHHSCSFGTEAVNFVKNRYTDWFFVSANTLDINSITSRSNIDISLKQEMQKHAKKTVLMMDSSKLNKTSYYKVFDYKDISLFITDALLPEEIEKQFQKNHIPIKI